MPADNDTKPDRTPEPFRKPATWGRPPQTVFRAGPLPRGERLAPLPEMPKVSKSQAARPQSPPQPTNARPDIFFGSMIPRPAYKPTPPLPTQAKAQVDTQPKAEPRVQTPPLQTDRPPNADLVVRPLPDAVVSAPAAPPVAPVEGLSESSPVASAPNPDYAAPPRSRPDRRPGRMPLVAGGILAALGAVAVGIWWLNRAPVAPGQTEGTPAVAETTAEPVLPPVAVSESAPAAVPPVSTAVTTTPVIPAANRPQRQVAERPSPRTPAAPVTASRPADIAVSPAPTTTAPPVVIEMAPPVAAAPLPTTAAPPVSDPDAPVVTRPQPLD